ncbi:unnamed protein product [Pleuronectes platessa]|uniref:Uncharacterized protein n=1 Tax=Pleuronectes platessa TaxID=8262 RepID=A0A9N7V7L3_PLEPL|nr:unnamed protein product [Pleuronectes platessa]
MSFFIQSEALGLRKDFILRSTSDIAPAAVKSSKCTGFPLCSASSTSGAGLLFSSTSVEFLSASSRFCLFRHLQTRRMCWQPLSAALSSSSALKQSPTLVLIAGS